MTVIPFNWHYENTLKYRVERIQKISKKTKWKKNRKK